MSAVATADERRVRVWLGEHPIIDYRADRETAEQYAEAMSRRLASCQVTNEPIIVVPGAAEGDRS